VASQAELCELCELTSGRHDVKLTSCRAGWLAGWLAVAAAIITLLNKDAAAHVDVVPEGQQMPDATSC
jgi:hypothetical protein